MARPRKEQNDRRTRSIGVRLTAHERAVLDAAAEARRVSPSELLRAAFFSAQGAQGRAVRLPPVPSLDPAAVAALNRVGANLNQLARRANAGDVIQPGEVPETLAALSQALGRIETLVFAEIER